PPSSGIWIQSSGRHNRLRRLGSSCYGQYRSILDRNWEIKNSQFDGRESRARTTPAVRHLSSALGNLLHVRPDAVGLRGISRAWAILRSVSRERGPGTERLMT